MKNIMTVLFFLLCINKISAQVTTNITWTEKTKLPTNNTIYYNASKKLVWANFEGKPTQSEPIAAITTSGFGYNASMHTINDKGQINVSIYCYFSKPNSWVRKQKNTAYILNHEQHHFDITYIAAKIFIDKVKAAALTTTNMNDELSAIYKQCYAAMNKMQNNYDTETKNGQIKEKQEEWNKAIQLLLDAHLMN